MSETRTPPGRAAAGLGMEAVGSTPEQYAVHIREELAKYARIVKAAGIKAD